MQSVDVVAPRAFLFSSPELRPSENGSSSRQSTSLIASQVSLGGSAGERRCSLSFSRRGTNSSFISSVAEDALDDFVLEPCQESIVLQSMSAVLLSHDNGDTNDDAASVIHHSSPRVPCDESSSSDPSRLPHEVISALIGCLNRPTFFALKAASQSWYRALKGLAPPPQSVVHSLPNEILVQIYAYLSPWNFNSARHTCRTWMRASLDRGLLITMHQRGGWMSGVSPYLPADATREELIVQTNNVSRFNLSCSISRECALSVNWTGNGISKSRPNSKPMALVQTGSIDFEDLANGYAAPRRTCPGAQQSSGLVFTVSVCGEFLMVAEAGIIYVYALEGNSIRPLTTIVCPRRVLAMGMDASSCRFAVAALLDGRMGIVCDMQVGRDQYDDKPSVLLETVTPPAFDSVAARNGTRQHQLDDASDVQMYEQNWINTEWNMRFNSGRIPLPTEQPQFRKFDPTSSEASSTVPLELGNRSIYRHLCSEDDPPRSVAICPQRRCVAFGCSAGIELHWVDALSGQSLNRWFPLTEPSDYLYFLPPRVGVDSTKKLRLISSAAHPILRRSYSTSQAWLSTLWGGFGFDSTRQPVAAVTVSHYDHYRAVPLSDGFHVLFTDPITGFLCLGTDAPLGGRTKLLRKIIFPSPPGVEKVPRLYCATCNLRYGPRIVAAYGGAVVLYCVPADTFRFSRTEQSVD
ncbi:hypothetical protein NA57DRAFT_47243, partial [Rhizodiscina lignyota]